MALPQYIVFEADTCRARLRSIDRTVPVDVAPCATASATPRMLSICDVGVTGVLKLIYSSIAYSLPG